MLSQEVPGKAGVSGPLPNKSDLNEDPGAKGQRTEVLLATWPALCRSVNLACVSLVGDAFTKTLKYTLNTLLIFPDTPPIHCPPWTSQEALREEGDVSRVTAGFCLVTPCELLAFHPLNPQSQLDATPGPSGQLRPPATTCSIKTQSKKEMSPRPFYRGCNGSWEGRQADVGVGGNLPTHGHLACEEPQGLRVEKAGKLSAPPVHCSLHSRLSLGVTIVQGPTAILIPAGAPLPPYQTRRGPCWVQPRKRGTNPTLALKKVLYSACPITRKD